MTGPLAASLARVAARERWLSVRATAPDGQPGWHRAADLLGDHAALTGLVERAAGCLADEHPGSRPAVRRSVAAAVLLADWCRALGAVGAGALAADRRVPDLAPSTVFLELTAGRVTGVAVSSGAFTCAREDRAAGHPHARPADDLDEALRAELTAHLTPLHALLRAGPAPLLRRGPRAMWGAAGDGVATALRLHAEQVTDPAPVLAVAERVLAGAPPSWGTAGYEQVVDPGGGRHLTRRRTSCCLYYRLPDTAACGTCPRTTAAERASRLGTP